MDTAGLKEIQAIMVCDFAPALDLVEWTIRDRVLAAYRNVRSVPKHWFRRFDRYFPRTNVKDPSKYDLRITRNTAC